MIAIYDVPEERLDDRNFIRRKLCELGFGMLQKSVWISPFHFETELKEFLTNNFLHQDVIILSAKRLWVTDNRAFAGKVWKLDKIAKRYQKAIRTIPKNKSVAMEIYYNALAQDPYSQRNYYRPIGPATRLKV